MRVMPRARGSPMVSQTGIAERIRAELAAYLKRDVGSVLPEHSLREDLGLDSMAVIELLYRIEEAFDLQIPDADLQNLVTVASVVTYVEGRLQPSRRPSPLKRSPRAPASKKKR